MANNERAGAGCIAVTGPASAEGGRIVYTNFPELTFHISTLPFALAAKTLLR
jgi:hypothetical protein